jgi:hypothetical protein
MLTTLFVNTQLEVTALPSYEEKEEQFREQVLRKPLETCPVIIFLHKFPHNFSK